MNFFYSSLQLLTERFSPIKPLMSRQQSSASTCLSIAIAQQVLLINLRQSLEMTTKKQSKLNWDLSVFFCSQCWQRSFSFQSQAKRVQRCATISRGKRVLIKKRKAACRSYRGRAITGAILNFSWSSSVIWEGASPSRKESSRYRVWGMESGVIFLNLFMQKKQII